MTIPTRSHRGPVSTIVAILVEILVTESCPNEDAAINLVVVAADLLGIRPPVYLIEVTDDTQADQQQFVGSPTIRVDGRDVAPPSPGHLPPSLSCRLYETSRGLSWVPDFKAVYAALLDAGRDPEVDGTHAVRK